LRRNFSLSGIVSGDFVSRRCSAVFDAKLALLGWRPTHLDPESAIAGLR
jgi:hypothetical protein